MKKYQVNFDGNTIWVQTDGKIVLPEDSSLSNLKEINILDDSSGIDLVVYDRKVSK